MQHLLQEWFFNEEIQLFKFVLGSNYLWIRLMWVLLSPEHLCLVFILTQWHIHAQITRVYKGKEHAEVEFTVSIPSWTDLVNRWSSFLVVVIIYQRCTVELVFLTFYDRHFRLGLYLWMMRLGRKSQLKLQQPWRPIRHSTRILMVGTSLNGYFDTCYLLLFGILWSWKF